MYVLFIVLNNGHGQYVREIIEQMRKLGVKGATIIDSMGSGRYQQSGFGDIPLIGGLMNSLNVGIVQNKTIFSVMESREQVEEVANAVEEILGGNMEVPGTGIMFSFPIEMVRGGKISTELKKKKLRDQIGYKTE